MLRCTLFIESELTDHRRLRGPNRDRGMLAFMGGEWCGLGAKELGQTLNLRCIDD